MHEQFECTHCETVHDFRDDALNCCAPHAVSVWVCPDCGEAYKSEDEAVLCICKNE